MNEIVITSVGFWTLFAFYEPDDLFISLEETAFSKEEGSSPFFQRHECFSKRYL